jgi:hypothetical protein
MLTESLETRWERLQPDAAKPVFQLVDASHPLAFYVGRAPGGERLLLLVTPERPQVTRTFKAVRIDVYGREDGRWSMLITLRSTDLGHVFSLFCEDLIEAGRSVPYPDKPLIFVMRRLALWQRLLERGGTDLLSEEAVRGLVAELLFLVLDLMPRIGNRAAVESWNGPYGADQDFQCPDRAWEVKAVRQGAEIVQIASENQLYAPSYALFLVVLGLADSEDAGSAFSLNSLISAIRSKLSKDADALELFDTRLIEAGYVAREEYERPLFIVPWMHSYSVTDSFPRIVKPELPHGTGSVRYELNLEACRPFLIEQRKDLRPLNEH